MRWLIDHVPEVKKAVDEGRCMFGTVDTWLIWVSVGPKTDDIFYFKFYHISVLTRLTGVAHLLPESKQTKLREIRL